MSAHRSHIARNVATARLSAIKEMAMRSRGIEGVASLTWGLPSFRTPEHIREAATRALADDPEIGKYALPNGLPELRARVARQHHARTGIEVDPEANVFITAGNMEGMSTLLRVVLEPGDEILVTDPGFASHIQQIGLCGGVPIAWPLDEAKGWGLDVDRLPELITPRTRGLVLVSPSNPTGTIFGREELLRVGEIAREHDLLIFLDDPYSAFTYENRAAFFDLSTRAELFDRLAYLFTFSKCHAMSGWRLGYMIVPEWLKDEVLKVHDATMICTPRISQVAGLAALEGGLEHVREFERELARRRELVCERLDRLPHVFDYTRPDGAYYVFPRILARHEDSWEFALRLLDEIRVTVTPGHAFGPSGEHHVRMAYCVDESVIETAFDRIERHFPA
jgi:aspartate/methionine/tyrosine aminotransferase